MYIRHTFLTIFIFLVFFSTSNTHASVTDTTETEGNPIVAGAELDLCSRYLWRGLTNSEGAVLQPSLWIGKRPFNFSIWGNLVLNNEANQGQFNEFNYTLQTEHSICDINLTVNIYYYQYPNQEESPSTGEVELICAYEMSNFEFSLTNVIDVIEYPGAYFGSLGVIVPLKLDFSEFYHEFGIGWSSAQFNDIYIELKQASLLVINYAISSQLEYRKFCFQPSLNLYYLPAERIRRQVDQSFIITGGVSISR